MIDVYDDCFSFAVMRNLCNFIQNSNFSTNSTDFILRKDDSVLKSNIRSGYSEDDMRNMGWFDQPFYRTLCENYGIERKEIVNNLVNCVTSADYNVVHTDGVGHTTIIFFANVDWKVEWGGHLLFLNKENTEAEKVVLFKPNRVVVFDGEFPHVAMTPNSCCPYFRYTYAVQYK